MEEENKEELETNNVKKLSAITGRNVICYYSNIYLSNNTEVSISDKDFWNIIKLVRKMDLNKGLDLILNTYGGDLSIAEAIGDYLIKMFNKDIRVIVPYTAMSSGTILTFIGKELLIEKHSYLGPINPYYMGISCHAIIKEYDLIKRDILGNPSLGVMLNNFKLGYLPQCHQNINYVNEVAQKWLSNGNLGEIPNSSDKEIRIKEIVQYLNNYEERKVHSRHIGIDELVKIGLNVRNIEEADSKIEEIVWKIHETYMNEFDICRIPKIIESQEEKIIINSMGSNM